MMNRTSTLRVLFRLDSGAQVGLGHYMRSKALADAFYKQGIECTFAFRISHLTSSNLELKNHEIIYINSEAELLTHARNYHVVIVDHYAYTSEHFLALSQLEHCLLVILDDECNRGALYADIIINPANQARYLNYSIDAPNARLLLGSDYILMAQNYSEASIMDYSLRSSIVITFGGSDITQLTLPVLDEIKKSSLNVSDIMVIIGAACLNSKQLIQYCHMNNFQYRYDVKQMFELLKQAKFALSAAGSTTFELACCGVPSVLAVVADNQLLSAKEHAQHGWCKIIDCRSFNDAKKMVKMAEEMIQSAQLSDLSRLAHSLIDGQGATRVAHCIAQSLKSN